MAAPTSPSSCSCGRAARRSRPVCARCWRRSPGSSWSWTTARRTAPRSWWRRSSRRRGSCVSAKTAALRPAVTPGRWQPRLPTCCFSTTIASCGRGTCIAWSRPSKAIRRRRRPWASSSTSATGSPTSTRRGWSSTACASVRRSADGRGRPGPVRHGGRDLGAVGSGGTLSPQRARGRGATVFRRGSLCLLRRRRFGLAPAAQRLAPSLRAERRREHARRGPEEKGNAINARAFANRYLVWLKNESPWAWMTYSYVAVPWELGRLARRALAERQILEELPRAVRLVPRFWRRRG